VVYTPAYLCWIISRWGEVGGSSPLVDLLGSSGADERSVVDC
jgi:hypothetical protein